MKKIVMILFVVFLGLSQAAEAGYMVTIFGPKTYGRTKAKPNVYQDTFAGLAGRTARLEITNGSVKGPGRVTSARVFVNDKLLLDPNDFKKKAYTLLATVQLREQNTLKVELQSAPQTYLSVRLTQDIPFEEGDDDRVKADLAVTDLTVTPDRVNPDDPVRFQATVENLNKERPAPGSTLVFRVDDVEISRLPVNPLNAGAKHDLAADFTASQSGRQQVTAALQLPAVVSDPDTGNNLRQTTLRVSGETPPIPELEFSRVDFDPVMPAPGQTAGIMLTVRNPAFVDLENVGLTLYIDGIPVPAPIVQTTPAEVPMSTGGDEAHVDPGGGGDDGPIWWVTLIIDCLKAGETQQYTVPWDNVVAGQHILKARLSNVPEMFPAEQMLGSWNVVIPALTQLNTADTSPPWVPPWMDKWYSIGPYFMTHPQFAGYNDSSDPWGGRVTTLAINPYLTHEADLVYAGGVGAAGIWKSFGTSWIPIGDQLPTMDIAALAIDPGRPDIIYASGHWKTNYWKYGFPTGPIFKYVNDQWHLFDFPVDNYTHSPSSYSKIEVRRLPNELVIYVATDQGLLRYKTNNANECEERAAGTWDNILPGMVGDFVMHPTNPDIIYAVRYLGIPASPTDPSIIRVPEGIWRTDRASTINPWSGGTVPFGWVFRSPTSNDMSSMRERADYKLHVDLFRANPGKVYASLLKLPTQTCESCGQVWLFYSDDEGQSWHFPISNNYYVPKGKLDKTFEFSWTRNSFLRSHPTREDWLYYGYVFLFRTFKDGYGQWYNQLLGNIHPDVHDLKFHPTEDYFYLAGDGGVYRGAVSFWTDEDGFEHLYDEFQGRNNDLRTAQIYDFDVSQTNPDVMIAGTQDEGTIEYLFPNFPGEKPPWKWRAVWGGDGMFSLIAPSDNSIRYCQTNTGLDTTRVSVGGSGWASRAHNGLVKIDSNGNKLDGGNQQIAVDPFDPDHLLAQGPWVQETTDGMNHWHQAGPPWSGYTPDSNLVVRQGDIRRVVFHPEMPWMWFAGTDKGGQVWLRDPLNFFPSWEVWQCIFEHPEKNARVVSMAFAPNNPNILYVAFDKVDSIGFWKGWFRLLRLQWDEEMGRWRPFWIAWDLPTIHVPQLQELAILYLAGDPSDDRVAYAATERGIYKGITRDADFPASWTWKPFGEGLPQVPVTKLIPLKDSPPRLRASTMGRGLWECLLRPPELND